MPTLLTILLAAVCAVLLVPADALAWGPGVHMALGNRVLDSLALTAAPIAKLLAVHGREFLYGCMSADIFVGKGSRFTPRHSHNWDTGFTLLERSESPEIKAYAWGYLSHLAADTIAHNYYVPNMLGLVPLSGRLGHVYLEMQADRRVEWDHSQARDIFEARLNAQDHSLIGATCEKPLRFKVKKRIYKGGLSMAGRKTLSSSLKFADRRLSRVDGSGFLDEMLDLSWRIVIDFLSEPESAQALALDPIGSSRLGTAQRFRRRQYILARHKGFSPLFPVHAEVSELPPVKTGTE